MIRFCFFLIEVRKRIDFLSPCLMNYTRLDGGYHQTARALSLIPALLSTEAAPRLLLGFGAAAFALADSLLLDASTGGAAEDHSHKMNAEGVEQLVQ